VLRGAIDGFLFAYLKSERKVLADGTGEPAVASAQETLAKKPGRPARTVVTRIISNSSARDPETPPAS
jgi:hypothetical protein